MKYIVKDYSTPILFPEFMFHEEFKCVKPGREITSAGYVLIEGDRVVTYGISQGLKLGPDENDVYLIKKLLEQGK